MTVPSRYTKPAQKVQCNGFIKVRPTTIVVGRYRIETHLPSPYKDVEKHAEVYVCEGCLAYAYAAECWAAHKKRCKRKKPPGKLIYREGNLSVFETDGNQAKEYCQNLSLLGKSFLEHKTLYYDVHPFLFYVLCITDEKGTHVVGYFSKEKESPEGYNLSCIVVLPPFRRCGFGKLLISISYRLTAMEGKTGTPERPLSRLGRQSYLDYWTHAIMSLIIQRAGRKISIEAISRETGINVEDILTTVKELGMVQNEKSANVAAVDLSPAMIEHFQALDRKVKHVRAEYFV